MNLEERIKRFISDFKLTPLDMNQSIINNFLIIEANFKAFWAAIKDSHSIIQEVTDNTNIDKITNQVYERVVSNRYSLYINSQNGINTFEFEFGTDKIKIITDKTSNNTVEIYQTEGDVKVELHKMLVLCYQRINGIKVDPVVQYITAQNDVKKLILTFTNEITQAYELVLI